MDTRALSELFACVGADNLPVSDVDVAALLAHGHLLVLDLGAGTLGAAAHVEVDDTRGERRAVLRYLAVHPALAWSGIEDRMAAAMREVCDEVDVCNLDAALAARDQVRAVRGEATRRISYLIMLVLAIPRVIVSAGHNHVAVAILVWTSLALIFAARTQPIPRAIVWRPRAAGLRAWRDAVLLRIGEIPLATYGRHALAPPPLEMAAETPITPLAPRS